MSSSSSLPLLLVALLAASLCATLWLAVFAAPAAPEHPWRPADARRAIKKEEKLPPAKS